MFIDTSLFYFTTYFGPHGPSSGESQTIFHISKIRWGTKSSWRYEKWFVIYLMMARGAETCCEIEK
jgi:hypothetical protein